MCGSAVSPSMPGIVRSSSTSSGRSSAGSLDRLRAVGRLADDVEAVLRQQRRQRLARERMVVDDEDAFVHSPLIGRNPAADER